MKAMLIALLSLVSASAFAAGSYGDAGCGLGSMVIGSDSGWKQVVAATLNSTGMQTFGITTGTSNCTEGGIFKSSQQVPAYIEMNKVALAKDAARGEGETIAGLAQLMGCNSESFGHAVKANYNQIFVNTNMEPSKMEAEIKASTGKACGA